MAGGIDFEALWTNFKHGVTTALRISGTVTEVMGELHMDGLQVFGIKAWGCMNGTGTPAWNASGNMNATITDNGTGDYSVTFVNDMPDANYAVVPGAGRASSTQEVVMSVYSKSTSGFSFSTNDNGSALTDANIIDFIVVR